MILILSAARELFWLGRYLVRADALCHLLPFEDDQLAINYAHAFCLPAWNAATLNDLLSDPVQPVSLQANLDAIWDNIQAVRAVISEASYIQLNSLSGLSGHDRPQVMQGIAACRQILGQEGALVAHFWQLGEAFEQMDIALRQDDMLEQPLQQLTRLVNDPLLADWTSWRSEFEHLQRLPGSVTFYAFSERLYELLEEGPCAS